MAYATRQFADFSQAPLLRLRAEHSPQAEAHGTHSHSNCGTGVTSTCSTPTCMLTGAAGSSSRP
jgi:hypothetical protein